MIDDKLTNLAGPTLGPIGIIILVIVISLAASTMTACLMMMTRSEKSDECQEKASAMFEKPPICVTKEDLERTGGTCDGAMLMMLKREREMIYSVWKNLGLCYDVNTDLRKLCDKNTYEPKAGEIPEPFSE